MSIPFPAQNLLAGKKNVDKLPTQGITQKVFFNSVDTGLQSHT